MNCDHLEADTSSHPKHAEQTHFSVLISSPHSDVFVIGLAHAANVLATLYLEMGTNKRIVNLTFLRAAMGVNAISERAAMATRVHWSELH